MLELVRDLSPSYPATTARVDVLPDGSLSVGGTPLSVRPHVYF